LEKKKIGPVVLMNQNRNRGLKLLRGIKLSKVATMLLFSPFVTTDTLRLDTLIYLSDLSCKATIIKPTSCRESTLCAILLLEPVLVGGPDVSGYAGTGKVRLGREKKGNTRHQDQPFYSLQDYTMAYHVQGLCHL
jgi:hypothetical protein